MAWPKNPRGTVKPLAGILLHPRNLHRFTNGGTAFQDQIVHGRNGIIIVDKIYLSDPDGIEFATGAIEGSDCCGTGGLRWSLITNQPVGNRARLFNRRSLWLRNIIRVSPGCGGNRLA
jgi:hypothetical protein